MVITPERLSQTIANIYTAVGSPEEFDGPLRQIRTLLNGSSGMLFTPFRDAGNGGFGFVDHLMTDLFAQYHAYYGAGDPWVREGKRKGRCYPHGRNPDSLFGADRFAVSPDRYPGRGGFTSGYIRMNRVDKPSGTEELHITTIAPRLRATPASTVRPPP